MRYIKIKSIILILTFFLIISNIGGSQIINKKTNHDNTSIKNIENYDLLIISKETYESNFNEFILHKNNLNIKTLFVSLDDIYNGIYFQTIGRDQPEKIKYFIKNAYDNWNIDYVLFAGSTKVVPVRLCYNDDNYPPFPEPKFVSELYYADIYDTLNHFSSWDFDGDGIIGEWSGNYAEDKNIDLKPEIAVGRLAFTDEEELNIVLNKIISYEKKKADDSWFKKIVLVGGDTYKKFEGYEGEIFTQRAFDELNDFTAIKLWASNQQLDKHAFNVIEEMNNGCGFIYFSGHGSTDVWVTNSVDGKKLGEFGKSKIRFLKNNEKLPVCLVGGCHNSQFSLNKPKSKIYTSFFENTPITSRMQGCWSWELVCLENGGCIATFGTTGLCWYSAEYEGGGTDYLHTQFFKEYTQGHNKLGDIWKNAITSFVETYPINWNNPSGSNSSIDAKSVQQWTLLGDPSLQIGGY